MSKKNEKQSIPSWVATGHAAPVTRRDFLAHGLIPFAAALTYPAWMQALFGGSAAQAAEALICPTSSSQMVPFVSLNLSGGGALSGNYVPMTQDMSTLSSYSKMGMGDAAVPIEREFGNAPFAGLSNGVLISKILEGIRASAARTTLDRTAFISFCVKSRDDTNENRADVSGLIAKAGVIGSRLPNMGSKNSPTGSDQSAAVIRPATPLIVRNFRDITNSLGYSAALGTQLNLSQKTRLAKLIADMNAEQARTLASDSTGQQIKNLLDCAGAKNASLLSAGTTEVDPASQAAIASLWNIQVGTGTGSENYIFSAMVYNALQGFAGPVSLVKGGYDYHDNTRATGDGKDREAGVVIGKVLETAALLGKPVALYVTTDGSVVSADSTSRNSPWTSDRGSAGVAYLFMFNPVSRPKTSGFQVGWYTNGQVADDKSPIGSSPEIAAQAVFANYLALNGKLNLMDSILPQKVFDAAKLAQVVKVG